MPLTFLQSGLARQTFRCLNPRSGKLEGSPSPYLFLHQGDRTWRWRQERGQIFTPRSGKKKRPKRTETPRAFKTAKRETNYDYSGLGKRCFGRKAVRILGCTKKRPLRFYPKRPFFPQEDHVMSQPSYHDYSTVSKQ